MMCTSSGGCASINHWTEGVWIEECIETDKDDDCDWAADFLNPDQSYRYVFGQANGPEIADDDTWDGNLLLTDAIGLYDSSTENFWTYCGSGGNELTPYCDLPIQLFQPESGLEDVVTELCGTTEEAWVWGWSDGILLREGEAVFNHNIQIECNASLPSQETQYLNCGYASVLRLD